MKNHIVALAALLAAVSGGAQSQAFDLGGLPSYRPQQQVVGPIRTHGNQFGTVNLVKLWEAGFMKRQPEAWFSSYLLTTSVGVAGLATGTADVAIMGHDIWRSDRKGFVEVFGYEPLEIMFATGGFDSGSTPGLVFFVNKDNPLAQLTLEQLDGIVGEARTGGWEGLRWNTRSARDAGKNIRTWGQLGQGGEAAAQPIRIYGIDATLSNWSGLVQRVVFKGGDKWNPALHEIVRGGSKVRVSADDEIVDRVANDRYAIGFAFMKSIKKNANVRPLALAVDANGPFVMPTRQTFQDRSYPLTNAVYIYLNRQPGQPLPARVKEFVRYALSREGQQAVAGDGTYLPLTEQAAREQLRKLD
jgi:phosphate transport system substrate-binding protein